MASAGFAPSDPVGALFAALRRKDPTATRAVRAAGDALGSAIATYLNLVDVPVVVLGSLLERLFPHLEPAISQQIRDRVLSAEWAPVDVLPARIGPHAVCEGAAWRILDGFIQRPDAWIPFKDDHLPYYSVEETPEVMIE